MKNSNPLCSEAESDYDRMKELKAFEDSKSGVKGLVDSGITNIPKMFNRPPDELAEESKHHAPPGGLNLQVPVIERDGDERQKIIGEVRRASKDWGFFQVLNHGVPLSVLSGMLDGVRMFHEQEVAKKQKYYSGDHRTNTVTFRSNFDLYRSRSATWRDTMTIASMSPDGRIEPHELPEICRSAAIEYMNHVTKLGETLLGILSEALGLERDCLSGMGCDRGRAFICHYYPACPQPELTLGISKHTYPSFLTILLQDQIGGLQVFRDEHWIDIQPVPGSFVVNIGDLLQMMSNDEFKSGEHRVVANKTGPRISVACFFSGIVVPPKVYGPIKDSLIAQENMSPLYKEFTVADYMNKIYSVPIGKSDLDYFRL